MLLADLTGRSLGGRRWVVLGPNGAGRPPCGPAAARLHPNTGVVHVLGERSAEPTFFERAPEIGLSSRRTAAHPAEEKVADVVVSAGYGVLGRWRERYDTMDTRRATELLQRDGVAHLAIACSQPSPRANASAP